MGLFDKIKQAFSANNTNDNEQNATTEFAGVATVRIRWSVADDKEVAIEGATTVRQLIEAQAKLANVDLSRHYVVLSNGSQVNLDDVPANGATYKITFSAGEAGVK